jgi:hypothetical protein
MIVTAHTVLQLALVFGAEKLRRTSLDAIPILLKSVFASIKSVSHRLTVLLKRHSLLISKTNSFIAL